MKRIHLIVGCCGLVAFIATGLYMHFGHDHLRGMTDALRLQYRSTHLYLLFTSLMNLALGIYFTRRSHWRYWLQRAGSWMVIISPVLAGLGFIYEPGFLNLFRPFSFYAAVASLSGIVLHSISSISFPFKRETSVQKPLD